MLNVARMLLNDQTISEFDSKNGSVSDSEVIFTTPAVLCVSYSTFDNHGKSVHYEVGQKVLLSIPNGVARVGKHHFRVKPSQYIVSHLN